MNQQILNMIYETLQKLLKQLEILKMKALVLRLCQEAGLDKDQTNLIGSVIECESGYNPRAINQNKDGSCDWGICQFNDYWYWTKMKLITPADALNDPEKSVRLMIKRYGQGFLKDWVCYSGDYYKKYLPKNV